MSSCYVLAAGSLVAELKPVEKKPRAVLNHLETKNPRSKLQVREIGHDPVVLLGSDPRQNLAKLEGEEQPQRSILAHGLLI